MKKKYFVVVTAIIAIIAFETFVYINNEINKPERVLRCFPTVLRYSK